MPYLIARLAAQSLLTCVLCSTHKRDQERRAGATRTRLGVQYVLIDWQWLNLGQSKRLQVRRHGVMIIETLI
jgi:hypothetical protein